MDNIEEEIIESPEIQESQTEIITPERQFIDNTEWLELWEFEKILESTEMIDWVLTTTRSIVEMDFEEKLAKRIKSLKEKVIDGTISDSERDDLRLLTS